MSMSILSSGNSILFNNLFIMILYFLNNNMILSLFVSSLLFYCYEIYKYDIIFKFISPLHNNLIEIDDISDVSDENEEPEKNL